MIGRARARVERVVAIGRRLSDPADPLGREARAAITAEGDLSPAGVELALAEHLETDPSGADLDALLAATLPAARCLLVLAANVCTAALRAIAVAVAAAPVVLVKPSRRDPAAAVILARELSADAAFAEAGGVIAVVSEVDPQAGDVVHVYGSDATVERFVAAAKPGVRVLGHGTGLGLAVVGAGASIREAAAALADDVVPFDQRGCLSPRAALVEGSADRAEAFAAALSEALAARGARVPRGPVDVDTAAAVTRYRATLEAVGVVHAGDDHLVGVDPSPRVLVLPPPARVVHVVPACATTAKALLARWSDLVTCVGVAGEGDLARAVSDLVPRARRAPLGRMQKPPLDGPVDLRQRAVAEERGEE